LTAPILVAAGLCSTSPALPAETQLPPQQVQAIASIIKSMTMQAATYCVPIVAMYNLRYSVSFAPTAKSKPGELWRFAQIMTPEVAQVRRST
jgi:hypothetical protein